MVRSRPLNSTSLTLGFQPLHRPMFCAQVLDWKNRQMAKLTRMTESEESIDIKPCPFCGGDVHVSDSGYTTFNPGSAKCLGKCKREWVLGYVENSWGAGLLWNKLQPKVREIEKLELKLADLKRK